jgi:hypothetical protein
VGKSGEKKRVEIELRYKQRLKYNNKPQVLIAKLGVLFCIINQDLAQALLACAFLSRKHLASMFLQKTNSPSKFNAVMSCL